MSLPRLMDLSSVAYKTQNRPDVYFKINLVIRFTISAIRFKFCS